MKVWNRNLTPEDIIQIEVEAEDGCVVAELFLEGLKELESEDAD